MAGFRPWPSVEGTNYHWKWINRYQLALLDEDTHGGLVGPEGAATVNEVAAYRRPGSVCRVTGDLIVGLPLVFQTAQAAQRAVEEGGGTVVGP